MYIFVEKVVSMSQKKTTTRKQQTRNLAASTWRFKSSTGRTVSLLNVLSLIVSFPKKYKDEILATGHEMNHCSKQKNFSFVK